MNNFLNVKTQATLYIMLNNQAWPHIDAPDIFDIPRKHDIFSVDLAKPR